MDAVYVGKSDKPEKWPANSIECHLENICTAINQFKKNPGFKSKEVLVSFLCKYDLNQQSMLGLHRTTEYEVALINNLYFEASFLNLNILKTYLYDLVGQKTRMHKMFSLYPMGDQSLEIKEFSELMLPLKLYHLIYQRYNLDKDKNFANKLIDLIEELLESSKENDSEEIYQDLLANITKSYISLLNDISYFRCLKVTGIWAFTRDEIYVLFSLAAKLIRLNGDNPIERPLKGVLMTSISNYILKSRNNYNADYICKYISPNVSKLSIENNEIWMSTIEKLNDEREQSIVPELFKQNDWNDFLWANDVSFETTRKYYVSSFCKSLDEEKMKSNYGSCVYGYKDDRIAELLSPIYIQHSQSGIKIPIFTQVITFDVIYDREEAKEELNFLCKVIDCFDMDDTDKKTFLEQILQYWILSVKDEKWSHERERRYVIFIYDEYDYIETDMSNGRFIKLKTSLFTHPDFILGANPVKPYVKYMVDNKREVISMKPYLFCDDCLNSDFDIVASGNIKGVTCSICGSNNVFYELPGHYGTNKP